jgi:hypothetical protein
LIDENDVKPVFEPEPVIREVMEYIAKNISLKIKLVKMFKDGEVQKEIFEKLFESYSALGEHLFKNRREMIEKISYDIETMDKDLKEAIYGSQELKIRLKIGDVSEEEYLAKAPAFEWDIEEYKDRVIQKKEEKAFVESIASVMQEDEIRDLRTMGNDLIQSFEESFDHDNFSPEKIDKIKSIIEEALGILKHE